MKVKNLHAWVFNPLSARKIQLRLQKKIVIKKFREKIDYIAAADASFREDTAFGAVVVFKYPSLELIDIQTAEEKIKFPYIPGLLTFREGFVLLKAFKKIKIIPQVIFFDGQGIAHPQKMGIATHLGIILDKPTIGCAKSRLIGEYQEPEENKGAFSYLYFNGEIIGAVLRTRQNTKPIFVSPGHKIDLDTSIKIVLTCCKKYRIPEPIRFVHGRCSHC